jgi:hypothetical protein
MMVMLSWAQCAGRVRFKVRLILNLETAKAPGRAVSLSLRGRADEVIE